MNNKINLYEEYLKYSYYELLELFKESETEEERNFYINISNFKLACESKKIIEKK